MAATCIDSILLGDRDPDLLAEVVRLTSRVCSVPVKSVTDADVKTMISVMSGEELLAARKFLLTAAAARKQEREQEAARAGLKVDARPLELVVRPGGALVAKTWIEDESLRAQQQEQRAAAESQAKRDQRTEEAQHMAEHERAQTSEWTRRGGRGAGRWCRGRRWSARTLDGRILCHRR